MLLESILLPLLAYLFGSFSSAVVVSKLLGLPDPRTVGSGNPGATNVLRLGGKKAALITLVLDMLKGFLPIIIATYFTTDQRILAAVALAAFLGHLYPVFFRFRGGKGVATACGVFFGLSWAVALSALGTWLGVALLLRYSSLAALVAAACAPLYMYLFTHSWVYTLCALIMSILLFWRHRSNIRKLLDGSEDRIGASK